MRVVILLPVQKRYLSKDKANEAGACVGDIRAVA